SDFFNSDLVKKKIGIEVEEVTPQVAAALGLGDKRGVIINEVEPDSPAARAGLQKNMIITTVDGQVTWHSDRQPAPGYVPVAKALYGKKKGEKSQFEVIVPQRRGRYIQFQQATVEVTVR
ncbi:MAG TPA: PDZ domain-containing protein, partial [Methylomirabilota bacterium]|nr:PDZ domain-containing protein [Methylomirabilota bacterium]